MNALDGALCVGQWWLFDSTDPSDHLEAAELCDQCPAIDGCRRLLSDLMTSGAVSTYRGVQGTWAGQLFGRVGNPRPPVETTCGSLLRDTTEGSDNGPQETTSASRPRTISAATPVQGLRRPIGDDRLMHMVTPCAASPQPALVDGA